MCSCFVQKTLTHTTLTGSIVHGYTPLFFWPMRVECAVINTLFSTTQARTDFHARNCIFLSRQMCLSAEASKEMHVVEVQDRVGEYSKPVPIATLHPMCQPMVSFSGFELMPPVTFNLRSGQGPLFISGQHVTLVFEEEEEEEVFSSTHPLDHVGLQ
ncbi:nucleoplasmin-like isoform X1 [Coregonus clupeaformis]|uniref:nucleoplasmin-like isoform X1 n=1 Tax=Coregonus clupeaformis TaxID=59861 RepID=UPI001E1C3FF9|nr:nucleoplasmin-like isoform X1 [Coregonus clupeaformis]